MTAVTPSTAAATMTAITRTSTAPPPRPSLRLAEIARPAIADDKILVRVPAASMDRGAWRLMAGLPYPMRLTVSGCAGPGPQPGRSLAGTVESAGRHDRVQAGR